jgi:uncharacterized membrane protein YfcA
MAGLDGLLIDFHGAVYVGALCAVLGLCMAAFNWTFLIAGYDDSDIPQRVAGRMVGGSLLIIGVLTVGYGVILTKYAPPDWVGLTLTAVILAVAGQLIYRLNTYDPTDSDSTSS